MRWRKKMFGKCKDGRAKRRIYELRKGRRSRDAKKREGGIMM
jgi:hypothetical protein